MKVAAIESFVVSVPYRHREMSSVEAWGGAVDVLIWGVPERAGLGIDADEHAVAEAAQRYRRVGQYRPFQPAMLAREGE
jgi:hypothetical protein